MTNEYYILPIDKLQSACEQNIVQDKETVRKSLDGKLFVAKSKLGESVDELQEYKVDGINKIISTREWVCEDEFM